MENNSRWACASGTVGPLGGPCVPACAAGQRSKQISWSPAFRGQCAGTRIEMDVSGVDAVKDRRLPWPSGSRWNLARNCTGMDGACPSNMSSVYQGHGAFKAVDGDIDDFASTVEGDAANRKWVQVDLEKSQYIDTVRVWARGGTARYDYERYVLTFLRSGCCNEDPATSAPANVKSWETSPLSTTLNDMFAYCNLNKDGTASADQQKFCGCSTRPTTCTLQSALVVPPGGLTGFQVRVGDDGLLDNNLICASGLHNARNFIDVKCRRHGRYVFVAAPESSTAYLTFAEVEVFGAAFNLARACVGGACPTAMSSVMDQAQAVASDKQGWPSTYGPPERGNDGIYDNMIATPATGPHWWRGRVCRAAVAFFESR